MVDVPAPDDVVGFDFDRGADGMPTRTERAFQAHYDADLAPSGLVEQSIDEIERVYRADPDAVVSVSGGKDSMVTLALAAASDADHRAAHWDYGPQLIPREMARQLIENIRSLVPDRNLFVANDATRIYKPYQHATTVYEQLRSDERLSDSPGVRETEEGKPVGRARERLYRSVKRGIIGRQILGTRRAESGSRDSYIDGLFGTSMGLDAAFPLRDWSARDVWAYIVAEDVPYPDHYDRVAVGGHDGSPAAYESLRMGALFRTFRTPIVDDSAVHGVVEWRNRSIESTEADRDA